MKNLANCKPTEFFVQTNKIRKSVEKWLTDTDIMSIRNQLPKLEKITPDMSPETRDRIFEENKKKAAELNREKISKMLDAILGAHAAETMEILALVCFIEPDKFDEHPVEEYLGALAELLSNKAVLDFFISLAQLAQIDILPQAKA